jgi:outer membrane protein assembly factor BamB
MSISQRTGVAVLRVLSLAGLLVFVQTSGPGWSQVPAQKAAPPQRGAPVGKAPAAARVAVQPLGPVPAPGAQGQNNEFTDALTLPNDRKVKRQLEAARDDYIKGESWSEASQLLQAVLDRQEDVFVQVKRKGANGQEQTQMVSARSEADRLVGTMPANGLQFYEVQFGGQARNLLTKAQQTGDPHVLAEAVRRYFHTQAGGQAMDLLGTYFLDRGEALRAALCYKRLLRREGADQLSPLTLAKAVLAFRRVGDAPSKALADETWKRLADKAGSDGLRIGDETVSLDQFQKELDRAAASETTGPYDWPMFRGNASRSARGRGSAPFLESRWQHSTVDDSLHSETRHWIEQAQRQHNQAEPLLPAFFPIAAGGKLIYRGFDKLHAVDVKTGELVWDTVDLGASLDSIAKEFDKKSQAQTWFSSYVQAGLQNILFENSMIGSLSTDDTCVYAVDDLAVPPYPNMQQWGGWPGGQQISGPLLELSQRSRLVAFELESGKLKWERGDPHYDGTELRESFFLGPPLPLAGKLYVLTEKNAELRLVCLDAAKGEPVWTQSLATVRDRLTTDVTRRLHAVNLAYAEGVLVCPTNAGAILGVDLLSRSLVWAFPYREKGPEQQQPNFPGGVMMRRGFVMPMQDFNGNLQKMNAGWKMCAPIIQDGKVIFTAPDGTAVHCLNLQDGAPLWRAERRDDLFVAGIFSGKVVLVGKNTCRALNLADGTPLPWRAETGTPSGLGVASGRFYYLPLKNREVCQIDLDTGNVARSVSPKNEVPGNLLFYEGAVVSQTETAVTAYEQIDFKVAQIDTQLKQNPNDPVALVDRGELRLYKGDLAGAVADLHAAIKNNLPSTLQPKARGKLYTTLTELLQHDFDAAEQYLPEYKELCQVPVPDDATPREREKLQVEQRHRQAGYLCLLAKGRERQGKLSEAFQAYLDFGALAENKELLSVINEPAVKVRPDLWAQGRIAALMARATPEQKQKLLDEITRRWQTVQKSKDLDALQRFVAAFGTLFAIGRQARLELAERQMEAGHALEAEMQLNQLALQQEEPAMRARAVEALARLSTHGGQLEDAVQFYRILVRDYPKVVIRDGKTGADLFNDLATDKRFLPYLDEQDVLRLSSRPNPVNELPPGPRYSPAYYSFDFHGDLLPHLQHSHLVWTQLGINGKTAFEFKLLDGNTNEPLWTLKSPEARLTYNYGNRSGPRFPCYLQGHLAVFYLGHIVYGVDLAERKKLWEYPLLTPERADSEQPFNAAQGMLSVDPDGTLTLVSARGTTEKLGQIGPVTASYVCLRTQEGLVGLDPVRGAVLWTKNDLANNTQIFGDEQYVYLVETRDGGQVTAGRALRGRDGVVADMPNFADVFQHRQRILGGRLLVSENAANGGTLVRLYDIPSGKDLWKKALPANSLLLKTEEGDIAGMVEPDGKLTVLDLRTQQEVSLARFPAKHLEKVTDGLLLQDRQRFYVALNRPADANVNIQSWPNIVGLTTAHVNGLLYAFDRTSGKLRWISHPLINQTLLLEHFAELPMVVFSGGYSELVQPGVTTPVTVTVSYNKSNGKLVHEPLRTSGGFPPQPQGQFYAVRIDRQAGTIDLISHSMKLRYELSNYQGRASLSNQASDREVLEARAGDKWRFRVPAARKD